MRSITPVLILLLGCKGEPSAPEPVALPTAPAPDPTPAPPPPPDAAPDLTAAAIAAGIEVLTAYADIMRQHGGECGPALTRMYEVSASLAAEIDVLSMGLRTRDVVARIRKDQEDAATPLGAAWAVANDAAGTCTFVREYLATTMGMQFVKADKKK